VTVENPILRALDDAGLRLTRARLAVAEAIERQDGHFTAEDVRSASRIGRRSVGRATIFRSLDLLTELGLVERVDLPSGEHAYVTCAPAAHHHHLVCTGCGRSLEIGELGLEPILAGIESSTGFVIESHRLELFGRCATCQAQATTIRLVE
jgi:Fur family transcriptional regulator, ferric uptake regulator